MAQKRAWLGGVLNRDMRSLGWARDIEMMYFILYLEVKISLTIQGELFQHKKMKTYNFYPEFRNFKPKGITKCTITVMLRLKISGTSVINANITWSKYST